MSLLNIARVVTAVKKAPDAPRPIPKCPIVNCNIESDYQVVYHDNPDVFEYRCFKHVAIIPERNMNLGEQK